MPAQRRGLAKSVAAIVLGDTAVLLDMGDYDRHSQFELVEGKGARGKLLSRRVDTVAMACIVKILKTTVVCH